MFQRLCTPLRREGNLLGFFWLDHSGEVPDAASLTVISAYAERIAAALAHERFLEQRKRASEADAVRHILRGEALPSAARSRLAGSEACVAVALSRRFRSDLARQATEAELRGGFADLQRRLAARPTIGLVENAEGVFVVGVGRGGEAQMKADFEQLLSWLSSDGVRIGISEPRGNPMDLSDAYREARWSAEAAAAGGASNCITWASLGAGRTLFRLLNGRSVEKLLPAGFARLREVEGSDLLLSTLETYLEVGCDSKATAAAFSIHRSTLYQRLRRIEEVSGFDLKEGDDRLDLHLGLRLLRLGSSRTAVAS
ncbi:MAG: PucR family transcriptional regulator [Pirellulales bacterium]